MLAEEEQTNDARAKQHEDEQEDTGIRPKKKRKKEKKVHDWTYLVYDMQSK